MADNDIKFIQEQPDGSFKEVSVTPVAGQVLSFGDGGTPTSASAAVNIDGGNSTPVLQVFAELDGGSAA